MKRYINENQIGLFEFLNQQEQEDKINSLQEPNEIEDENSTYFGYENGPEHSILIHDYQHRREPQYSYFVNHWNGYIYIGKQKIGIDIFHMEPPSLDNRYHITLDELNDLPLPNYKWSYENAFFRDLKDLVHYVKSGLADKSLIYDQQDFIKDNDKKYGKTEEDEELYED